MKPASGSPTIVKISEASIPTRYPDDLAKVQKNYSAEVVRELLDRGREVTAWEDPVGSSSTFKHSPGTRPRPL
jgi:hypothetical protein